MKYLLFVMMALVSIRWLNAEEHAKPIYNEDHIKNFALAMPNEFKRMDHENQKLFETLKKRWEEIQKMPNDEQHKNFTSKGIELESEREKEKQAFSTKEQATDEYYRLLNKVRELGSLEEIALSRFKDAKEGIEDFMKTREAQNQFNFSNNSLNDGMKRLQEYNQTRNEIADGIEKMATKYKLSVSH